MKNIVILTGAGISEESGIKTYRDQDGLWAKYDPQVVSHINGWKKDPNKVIEFKDALRRDFAAGNYKPNSAHLALTKLQKNWKHGEVAIITQNIDGLHEDAGSLVFEMHGTGKKKYCHSCAHFTAYDADIGPDHICVNCGKTATTRPFTVLFGEMPTYLDLIETRLDNCQIFIGIGTSGSVMPASLFVTIAKQAGAKTYLINKGDSYNSENYDIKLFGNATELVPKLVDEFLEKDSENEI